MCIVIPVKKSQIINAAGGTQVKLTDRYASFSIDHLNPRISGVAFPPRK